jgi:hypothetical protein
MATIYDKGDNWHLVISPNAKYVQEINEPAKGYSATLGEDPDTGKHVVMDVHYNKQKYTLDDVTKFVEKSRNCPKCDALDKEKMQLQGIEMREPNPNVKSFGAGQRQEQYPDQGFLSDTAPPVQAQAAPPVRQSQSVSPLKDIFANVFFDAYLTTPGKYFLGMMLNDDKILDAAMPKSADKIPEFMEEMVDFLAGKIDFVRSPDEVKEYLSVLKKDDDTKTGLSSSRDRRNKKKSAGNAVLIY